MADNKSNIRKQSVDFWESDSLLRARGKLTLNRFMRLYNRLLTIYHETFWIEVENDFNDGKEYFRYKEIEHTKNPNAGQFDILIEQNLITIDLSLCRTSGHGDVYSFKIKKKGMPLLFPESITYSI